ncbi:unnamed protein product, partial [Adineta ricciae]
MQRVTTTRQAFEARLELDNSGDTSLEQIKLDILITDGTNKLNTTDRFSVGKPLFSGALINDSQGYGSLEPSQSGSITWLIIPYASAAYNQTTTYWIGGHFSYVIDGQHINIKLIPDSIEVEPEALLDIAYFLEKYVTGPDPLSTDSFVQEPQPFTLGMIVTNSGFGLIKHFRIASSQPEIIENEKGLLINFQIVSMHINNEISTNPSLQANIGDVKPNLSVNIRWTMLASLAGKFISFNASFTETNPNGDSKLSLINSFTTHTLIRLVSLNILNEILNDDLIDFLVMENANVQTIPDTVISSTNATLAFPVYHILNISVIIINQYTIIILATPTIVVPNSAYVYIRTENIWPMRTIRSSHRLIQDQDILVNTWTTRRVVHLLDGDRYDDYLHIFDRWTNQQSVQYEITFDTDTTIFSTMLTEMTETSTSSQTMLSTTSSSKMENISRTTDENHTTYFTQSQSTAVPVSITFTDTISSNHSTSSSYITTSTETNDSSTSFTSSPISILETSTVSSNDTTATVSIENTSTTSGLNYSTIFNENVTTDNNLTSTSVVTISTYPSSTYLKSTFLTSNLLTTTVA